MRPPQTCFMLACLGFWNTRVNRGCGTWRKSRLLGGTASLGLGPGGWVCVRALPCRKRTLFLVGNVDNRDWHRIGGKCVGTSGRCDVSRQKHVHPKTSASRSEFCSSRDHTTLSVLAMILTMNARRFQRTHSLSGMGSSLNALKDMVVWRT